MPSLLSAFVVTLQGPNASPNLVSGSLACSGSAWVASATPQLTGTYKACITYNGASIAGSPAVGLSVVPGLCGCEFHLVMACVHFHIVLYLPLFACYAAEAIFAAATSVSWPSGMGAAGAPVNFLISAADKVGTLAFAMIPSISCASPFHLSLRFPTLLGSWLSSSAMWSPALRALSHCSLRRCATRYRVRPSKEPSRRAMVPPF